MNSALQYGVAYLLTLGVFLLIDFTWLAWIAKDLYKHHLAGLMAENVNWTAVAIFYPLFIGGLFGLVLLPAIEKNSLKQALLLGAVYGACTYATYDLTNWATLKNWPAPIVWIDILWGIGLNTLVSGAGFFIIKWLR